MNVFLCQFLLICQIRLSSVIRGIRQDLPAQYVVDATHVECRLTEINVDKSPGSDGLPNWLLWDLAPSLGQPLAANFNASLREGYHRFENPWRYSPRS